MKIIKAGKPPEVRQHWYFEVPMTCDWCHTEYLLEEGDDFRVHTVRPLSGHSTVVSTCPVCGVKNEHSRPNVSLRTPTPEELHKTTLTVNVSGDLGPGATERTVADSLACVMKQWAEV